MSEQGHFVKPLTATTIPRSHIVLTVAGRRSSDSGGYAEVWRCGSLWWQHERGKPEQRTVRYLYHSLYDMWEQAHSWALKRGLTVLWVHDLHRVARLTGMLEGLPARGWQLDALSLAPGASWLAFRRGKATLKVVDVMSIWPTSIDRLGVWFDLGRMEIPMGRARVEQWNAWVTRDRDILVVAVESYLDWIQREGLGSLAVTGSAQAWRAFRRGFLRHGILVHDEADLREMERRAMWTGRCEAWWRGSLLREVADEWDFSMAHNTIASQVALPVFPDRPIGRGAALGALLTDPRSVILAEVEVSTRVPCVPTESDGHILWPVGRFRTVLWSPELRIALDECEEVILKRGWVYRAEPVLRDWADWIEGSVRSDNADVPAWRKDILKRWGNVLIGRFGMRYPQWRKVGRAAQSDVSCVTLTDAKGSDLGLSMQVGYELWEQSGTAEPRDAAPMITGYVMSEMRARIWSLMKVLPPRALLYVDTDAVLALNGFRAELAELASDPRFSGLRLKHSWQGLSIYGPRQIVTGDTVRVAGLPKSAQRLGRKEFEGEVTESLTAALQAGRTSRVRSVPRQWSIEGVDQRRKGTGFGWTEPFHIGGGR